MTELDDIDALAAEYVLGTLDAAERTAVAARRGRERALDTAIGGWEQRLAPLTAAVAPRAPPPELKSAVLARIAANGSQASSGSVVAGTRNAYLRAGGESGSTSTR